VSIYILRSLMKSIYKVNGITCANTAVPQMTMTDIPSIIADSAD